MDRLLNIEYISSLSKNLLWIGIVTMLVGAKLFLSFLIPGLKTPGELLISGALLLIYTVKIFRLRAELDKKKEMSS